MKYLIKKEISLFFASAIGYVIMAVWLLAVSFMLWVFPGKYNIPDGGYATLRPFFSLVPVLLFFLVPAACVRLLAEERKTGNMELLFSRPLTPFSIIMAKYISACLLMLLAVLFTLLYIVTIRLMSVTGVDIGETTGGYIGIICLISSFSAIGIFASSITSNQIIAFLLTALLCFAGFYGFDLLATLYSKGNFHNFFSDLGMDAHYRSMVRGVVDSKDILYFLCISAFFIYLSIVINTRNKKRRLYVEGAVLLIGIILTEWFSTNIFIRFDLTEGKRYTLSAQTQALMKLIDQPLQANLYLNGDLNPAFDRLRTASINMLEELAQYVPDGIILRKVNPSLAPSEKLRQESYIEMDKRGMKGISVNERDREGRISSKVVFPWIELIYDGDTVSVGLLKNNVELSPQKILNISIANLEYGLTDAIRVLTMKEISHIAFIEGHGEWDETDVYEATKLLSKYYNIDRGKISGRPEELYPYKVLIIAGAHFPFTETEKFALDQYLMNGGSILFLIDGTRISQDEFNVTGESVTLKNEVNLDDLLFTYGVRINPVTVQDMNCLPIRVVSSTEGARDAYSVLPWYFAPLLEPVKEYKPTYDLSPLKAEQVSTVSLVGNDSIHKEIWITTSADAHVLAVPEKVSLRYVEMPADPIYFNESHLPVVVALEGNFSSAFRNRVLPKGAVLPIEGRLYRSKPARIVVGGSASLIKNEWKKQGKQEEALPLGFDSVTGDIFGNADFLVNTVNYLAGNEEWIAARSFNSRLRLLDKRAITTDLIKWQIFNVIIPLFLLFAIGSIYLFYRKRKYSKKYGKL